MTIAVALLSSVHVESPWARTIPVAAGSDLQAAIDAARGGDVIALENGATFTGNFLLPKRPGADGLVTIRPAMLDGLPAPGDRVDPNTARSLPRLRSPNGTPALRTALGTRGWRLELIEVTGASGAGDLLALGDGSADQRTLDDVARDIVVDRCYVHGDSEVGRKRCIALNSAATTITGSHVSDCKADGQDSQAIGGWNGPGPFTITNNRLEGAGENIMFGGADPSIQGLVPSDIEISGNTIEKPLGWRGSRWQVKNLLELKNARRVTIRGNVLRNNWQAAQSGFAVLFTVRNQGGQCPWCQVEDVTFEDNRLEHISGGLSILGRDDVHPSGQTRNITIRNNLVADLDSQAWGGRGYFVLLLGGASNIVIEHNTIIQPRAAGLVQVDGGAVNGFVFSHNVARHSQYGIIGSDRASGADTIGFYLPSARIEGNVIADASPSRYPPGNHYPSFEQLQRQFVAYSTGDYRLSPGSPWRSASSRGGVGADLSRIPAF